MNLRDSLLAIGGKKVLMPETIPDSIDRLGHLYDMDVIIPIGGTSRYFMSHEDEVRIMWGFVLDTEGIWKMHSWLIEKERQIILDNVQFEKYFGFVK